MQRQMPFARIGIMAELLDAVGRREVRELLQELIAARLHRAGFSIKDVIALRFDERAEVERGQFNSQVMGVFLEMNQPTENCREVIADAAGDRLPRQCFIQSLARERDGRMGVARQEELNDPARQQTDVDFLPIQFGKGAHALGVHLAQAFIGAGGDDALQEGRLAWPHFTAETNRRVQRKPNHREIRPAAALGFAGIDASQEAVQSAAMRFVHVSDFVFIEAGRDGFGIREATNEREFRVRDARQIGILDAKQWPKDLFDERGFAGALRPPNAEKWEMFEDLLQPGFERRGEKPPDNGQHDLGRIQFEQARQNIGGRRCFDLGRDR